MNIPTGYRVRGQKTLALFSFVWRKRDCSLTTEYSFAKYFLFVIVMSISVCSGTPRPVKKQRAMKGGDLIHYRLKISDCFRFRHNPQRE